MGMMKGRDLDRKMRKDQDNHAWEGKTEKASTLVHTHGEADTGMEGI